MGVFCGSAGRVALSRGGTATTGVVRFLGSTHGFSSCNVVQHAGQGIMLQVQHRHQLHLRLLVGDEAHASAQIIICVAIFLHQNLSKKNGDLPLPFLLISYLVENNILMYFPQLGSK